MSQLHACTCGRWLKEPKRSSFPTPKLQKNSVSHTQKTVKDLASLLLNHRMPSKLLTICCSTCRLFLALLLCEIQREASVLRRTRIPKRNGKHAKQRQPWLLAWLTATLAQDASYVPGSLHDRTSDESHSDMDARWIDSLQCAMALAMPSCFSRSESSRRAGDDD